MSAIQTLVARFVSDIENLVRAQALESVRAALEGARGATRATAAPTRRSSPTKATMKPATAKSAPQRERRSAQDIAREADQLVVAVKAKPGSTAEQLKAATRLAAPELAIKSLLAAKRIRKTGEKRATKYFPG